MAFIQPGALKGSLVVLEPLEQWHREPLRQAASEDESIWTYFPIHFNGQGDDFDLWFDYTMERFAKREHFPFAVILRSNGKVIGTTRFYDMVPDHKRLAIGSSWYTIDSQGTLINPECRYLLLTYAFESLEVNRVELITDPQNLSSRAAMRILGAVEEGRIRNHLIYKDGRIRDSLLFSIIRSEWPTVKAQLLKRLESDNEKSVVD